jgi:hypothetical protein
MPPPNGITYAMMLSSELKGGHTGDDTDQHAGDRVDEGQFPSVRSWIGWGGFIQPCSVMNPACSTSGQAAILHRGDENLRHVMLM